MNINSQNASLSLKCSSQISDCRISDSQSSLIQSSVISSSDTKYVDSDKSTPKHPKSTETIKNYLTEEKLKR